MLGAIAACIYPIPEHMEECERRFPTKLLEIVRNLKRMAFVFAAR